MDRIHRILSLARRRLALAAFVDAFVWGIVAASIVAVLAVAALFPLITGNFDFSIAAIMSVSAMICATTMSRFHEPLLVAVVFAVAAGIAIGFVNGFLVAHEELIELHIEVGNIDAKAEDVGGDFVDGCH